MSESLKELTLPVAGMTCASCVAHVEKALNEVPGVAEAAVNLATERATVKFENGGTGAEVLVQAVRDSGYDVPGETVTLPIGGMTCASCVAHVEKGLNETAGVTRAAVNLATERAKVTYIPGLVDLTGLKAAVAETGYQVLEVEAEQEDEVDQEERKMAAARFRMRVAWGFTTPIILWMFAEMFFGIVWPNELIFNLGMIALALPVLFWVGWPTYRGAWAAVSHKHAWIH